MTARFFGALVAAGTLLLSALATGGRIYYLLLFTVLALILLSLASVLWSLFTMKIDMKGVRPRVQRGEKLMTIFTARHTSLLPVASVRLQMNVPSAFAGAREISVATPPFRTETFRYMIVCPHRGRYEVGVTHMVATDLMGFFSISKKAKMKPALIDVYPRVNEVPVMELKASDSGPELRSRATEDAASPSDVRKWQEGDVLKKVHWKLTMRKRELMVRTYEEASRPDTLIVPDLSEIAALPDQALSIEDCICEACLAQAKAQLEAGYPVRMPLTCARPSEIGGQSPEAFVSFLDALMHVQFDSPFAYEQVQLQMLRRTTRTGGIVMVTSKLTTRVADLALKTQRSGVLTKLVWVTDSRRDQSLEMVERLKMEGVSVSMVDPWAEQAI